MELAIWRNIKDTSRKIFSPLEYRATRWGISAIAGIGVAVYSLPPIIEGQISPLEVYVKCQNSKPQIEVIGNISVDGAVNLLVVEEVGSRRSRVLERSGDSRQWIFNEVYPGFADPESKYTELPAGRYNFRKNKEYRFKIYSSGHSLGKTPLDRIIHEEKRKIPSC